MRAVKKLQGLIEEKPGMFQKRNSLRTNIEAMMQYTSFIETIEDFWLEPTNRETNSWRDHLDINMVMLATSLAPDGYLTFC
jgi:hypothetical protein